MKFMPHDYQKYAIEYIKSHPITALFLDMGLGKTVTTLTAIRDLMYDAFEVKRVLVIAPLRVARDTWPDELRKWDHLKELTCSVVVGTVAERRRALQQDADIYIVNRENLAWLYENSRLDFDMVVLDELSSFKNHQSKRFRAMKAMRPKVKRIVGLTGTPTGNGLMDLWAEFRILDRGGGGGWEDISASTVTYTSSRISATAWWCIPTSPCRERKKPSITRFPTSPCP